MKWCCKCGSQMNDDALFCRECGTKAEALAEDAENRPYAKGREYSEQRYTQLEEQPVPRPKQINKPRKGMKTLSVICFVFAVIYALVSLAENSMFAMTVFFEILGLMFLILSESPKENAYVLGKPSGMKKATFIPACVILAFVLFGGIASVLSAVDSTSREMPSVAICSIILIIAIPKILTKVKESKYKQLEAEVLRELGFANWDIIPYYDEYVTVKSRQTLEKYDDTKFFKDDKERLVEAEEAIREKDEIATSLIGFLESNEYQGHPQYPRIVDKIESVLGNVGTYRICVDYVTSAGNYLDEKEIVVNKYTLEKFKRDPSLLMGKGEYNKLLKEQQKEALSQKHHDYYEQVNSIIDYANENRDLLVIKGSQEQLDNLIAQVFDRTVNSIKKIKSLDSEEWNIIGDFIARIKSDVEKVVIQNQKILAYYDSPAFCKIKETCEVLMSSQREFNEYISEKVESISLLFGTRVVRNTTVNDDEYNYIRPYKKTITPFTAEVSAAVFASAENNPLDYIVKNFYPNKALFPEQIQKLHLLVEELETLREAKQIIENYKAEYQQYLGDVPDYIMKEDEAGFYSRLGFAHIDESVLTVEYKFSYTSGGGMAQRSFTIPMTEETIVELIKTLESKLTASAFAKEQRLLMTRKLREFIKNRDNFTCCACGNSTHAEPNLLLEIDHIIPVSKGGCTTEDNLQTLCWKCNRAKSDKILT